MNTTGRISIISPCRNERDYIRGFVESLLAQEVPPGWELEVLIADGTSDDGTRAILDEFAGRSPGLRVVANPGRIVSSGLNAPIREATGDVIVRMDAHTTYAPDYVRACLETLERTGADNVGGPWRASGENPLQRAIALVSHSPFATGRARSHRLEYEGEVDTVYLGCWRKEVFERVGLFDEELVRNQDDELNLRIATVPQGECSVTVDSGRRPLKAGLFPSLWRIAIIGDGSNFDRTTAVSIEDIPIVIPARVQNPEGLIAYIVIPSTLTSFESGTKSISVATGAEVCTGTVDIE